ncbi:MAG: nucleotidyltransferase family protein [Planctomycetia bacterium]
MWKLDELRRCHRDDVLRLCADHGAYDVRIFGSVLNGTATDDSDVDFFVAFEKGRTAADWRTLREALQRLLGCRVDLVVENHVLSYRRAYIQRHSVAF